MLTGPGYPGAAMVTIARNAKSMWATQGMGVLTFSTCSHGFHPHCVDESSDTLGEQVPE